MKILMTLMGLEIGGAETHVLELSRALADMGAEVTVASNGGVYVKELEACGIKHIKLPLHTKRPFAVLKSYLGLKKLIKKEKFDIVHAHARIPAFICGLLHKKLHFRFVCSAHWVFDINALWRTLADWGERTIAVSEDIKQYVIDNYGVFADNISVTINGVDMKKFSPDIDCSEVRAELGIPDGAKTLVYVSRMDKDRSAVARMLASIAPALREKYPTLQIVIVGGGDDFDYVKSLAERANTAAGTEFVKMTGARTDINRLIALGDVFIGVSRAVLEAMSASKPVVIAGNEGYIGLLDESNMDVAVATNFCCRGCESSSEELLMRDLSALLDLGEDEIALIGEKNRRIIKENYSAARMARDCMTVYESLYPYDYKKHSDIVFSGYYGFGNTGDDSLLISIIDNLRRQDPDVRITAFTRRPKKMCRKYGVKCVGRFNVFAMIREMRHARLLISGGGSLFQNNTSTKSLEYYIQVIKMAKRMGLSVMVYANGIGPLYGERSRRRVIKVLSEADEISLREPSSYEFLREIGLSDEELGRIRITSDPALTLGGATRARTAYILEKAGIDAPLDCFAVSLREWQDLKTSSGAGDRDAFVASASEAIALVCKRTGKRPVFIPVQRSYDDAICFEVKKIVEQRTAVKCPMLCSLTASEVISLLSEMSFVIGMRLHMIIYASAAGIPAIGLSYDPKVKAFSLYADQFEVFDGVDIDPEEISHSAERLLTVRDSLCERIARRAAELSKFASEDAEKALEYIK
ncbi:MAG: polysaccharide pyruvyl transferase CsaB [Ruminococcaceae bacterium]|nr:polysaccharide pyruvyl transferase CsaB [Oscillospiraceae bacterium]